MRTPLFYLSLLITVLAIIAVLVPHTATVIHNPDFGNQLTKGYLILNGVHPFIDIKNAVYGPSTFYLSAVGQAVFPDSIVGELILIVFGYLLAYTTLHAAARKLGISGLLIMAFCVCTLLIFPRFHKYHVLLPLALGCLGLATVHQNNRKSVFLAGVLAGIAIGFRIDFGIYAVISIGLILILDTSHTYQIRIRRLFLLCSGFVLTLVPWLTFLLLTASPFDLVNDVFNASRASTAGLSLPPPSMLSSKTASEVLHALGYGSLFIIPGICIALSATWIPALRTWVPHRDRLRLIGLSAFCLLVFLHARYRPDVPHIRQAAAPLMLLVFYVLSHLQIHSRRLKVAKAISVTLAVAVAFSLSQVTQVDWKSKRIDTLMSWTQTKSQILDNAAQSGSNLAKAIIEVKAITSAEQSILALPFMAQVYFFAERKFDTDFGWLNPGRFLHQQAQQDFISALHGTALVIDQPKWSFDGRRERNARSYAPELMEHLYTTFGLHRQIGNVMVLARDPQLWQIPKFKLVEFRDYPPCRFDTAPKLNTLETAGSVSFLIMPGLPLKLDFPDAVKLPTDCYIFTSGTRNFGIEAVAVPAHKSRSWIVEAPDSGSMERVELKMQHK